ncbi:MAG: hypothetical protein HRT90_10490 [Candidatus Margulisbacteria bacterium]|nr:hypothetical protein [Candidatus Margulisiibacteriota bacterium]
MIKHRKSHSCVALYDESDDVPFEVVGVAGMVVGQGFSNLLSWFLPVLVMY